MIIINLWRNNNTDFAQQEYRVDLIAIVNDTFNIHHDSKIILDSLLEELEEDQIAEEQFYEIALDRATDGSGPNDYYFKIKYIQEIECDDGHIIPHIITE